MTIKETTIANAERFGYDSDSIAVLKICSCDITSFLLQAEINCMEDSLTKNVSWKYYINLASQAFPLKTNEELVKILKIYNGSNIISSLYGEHLKPKRFKYKVYYTKPENPGEKPMVRKGKTIKNPPPPHNITILKGSAYGLFR